MRGFEYRRWSGRKSTVAGVTDIVFSPAHVQFWRDGTLLLAERNEQVNELMEVANDEEETPATS